MSLTLESLRQAQESLADDAAWRALGNTDCTLFLSNSEDHFKVEFHAFRVRSVDTAAEADARDCDVHIRLEDWSGYLQGRVQGTSPLLAELDLTDHIVSPDDSRARLLFMRYHLSIQYFLDRMAGVSAAA